MSTKASLAHGQKFHLYTEVWDNEAVWLTVEGNPFEVSDRGATIRIPIATWEYLRTVPTVRFDLATKTNLELKQLADAAARENRTRYREYVRGQNSHRRHRRPLDQLLFPRSGRSAARILEELKYRKRRQQRILRAIDKLKKFDTANSVSSA